MSANIGGIMGLFMGFSFISLAEIIYFTLLRPIFKFVLPKKFENNSSDEAEYDPTGNDSEVKAQFSKPHN